MPVSASPSVGRSVTDLPRRSRPRSRFAVFIRIMPGFRPSQAGFQTPLAMAVAFRPSTSATGFLATTIVNRSRMVTSRTSAQPPPLAV